MRRWGLIVFLLVLNAFLALGLMWRGTSAPTEVKEARAVNQTEQTEAVPQAKAKAAFHPVRSTAFAGVYSTRPAEFAGNLRRAGCPEETVKDILAAEIGRRYR